MKIYTVLLEGVPTALASRDETAKAYIDAVLRARRGELSRSILATSMNGQTIYETRRSKAIRQLFQSFDLISMDGQPAVTISRRWPRSFAERVATTDLIHDVVRAGLAFDIRHYVLGADARVNELACTALQEAHPGIIIAGAHHGYVDDKDLTNIADKIRASGAEIVWVCMGVPREQAFTIRLAQALPDIAVFKTGGGVLDFVSGEKKRAPSVLQNLGLEWIFRLAQEPKRLFARYLLSNPVAMMSLVTTRPIYGQLDLDVAPNRCVSTAA